jgi:hypothetical protein
VILAEAPALQPVVLLLAPVHLVATLAEAEAPTLLAVATLLNAVSAL